MATFTSLSLADVHVNTKGAKTCQLLDGTQRLLYVAPEYCAVPFPPSNFDKDPAATRLNLELRAPPTIEAYFESLDAWMIDYLTIHSERLLKRGPLSREQVKESYHGTLRRKEDYPVLRRTKLDTSCGRACKYWTEEQEKRDAPEEWRATEVRPQLHISHLWIMGRECGLVVNVEALLVREESTVCPF